MSAPETIRCPRCSKPSPLTDYNEVDIGVGSQRFDECWTCPDHGEFWFEQYEDNMPFSLIERRAVFRRDEP